MDALFVLLKREEKNMSTAKSKSYTPKVRRDFIEAVILRAVRQSDGITEKEVTPVEKKGLCTLFLMGY